MTLHIESAKHGHQNRKCFILETAQLNEKVKFKKKRHTGIIYIYPGKLNLKLKNQPILQFIGVNVNTKIRNKSENEVIKVFVALNI